LHRERSFRRRLFALADDAGADGSAPAQKSAENGALDNEVFVNQFVAHAELIATFRRAQADAAHKFGLIKTVEKKGPKAIQAAIETAAKAAKRRDSYAKSLNILGVSLED
jgi:hypothetical protein